MQGGHNKAYDLQQNDIVLCTVYFEYDLIYE